KDIGTAFQDALIRHKSVDFGWRLFGVVRRGTCDAVAEQILQAYEEQCRYHDLPSALGHSFGTLAIGRALKSYPDLKLDRVIVFGSILAPDYPWNQIHANGQVQALLNEKSSSDSWARLAKYCIPDSGPSGVDGFQEGQKFLTETEFPWTAHS